jgi:hypothetical protein
VARIFGATKLLVLAKPSSGFGQLQWVKHFIEWLTRLYVYNFVTCFFSSNVAFIWGND